MSKAKRTKSVEDDLLFAAARYLKAKGWLASVGQISHIQQAPGKTLQFDLVLRFTGGKKAAKTEVRKCTCHPSEAPVPCQQKYALTDCIEAARGGKP